MRHSPIVARRIYSQKGPHIIIQRKVSHACIQGICMPFSALLHGNEPFLLRVYDTGPTIKQH